MDLHVYYQNCRGLRTKLRDFRIGVNAGNFDIVCITESYLLDSVSDGELCDPDDYSIFRRDRRSSASLKKDGGGVLLLVKNDLHSAAIPEFQSEAEDLWVLVTVSDNFKFYLCSVYLPPLDEHALSCFVANLDRVGTLTDLPVVLCGDFNRPYLEWSCFGDDTHLIPTHVDNGSTAFVDSVTFSGLMQFNTVRNCNNRLLDLVFCNSNILSNISRSDLPIIEEDSHHPSIEFTLTTTELSDLRKRSFEHAYCFRKAPYCLLSTQLQDILWADCFEPLDLHGCIDFLYSTLNNLIQTYIPLKRINVKYPDYYSASTIRVIKEKNRVHKKWKITQDVNYYNTFKYLRRRSKRLIADDLHEFTRKIETQVPGNPRSFWRFVSCSRRSKSGVPSTVKLGAHSATTGQDICDLFATHFKSVFNQTKSSNYNIPNHSTALGNLLGTVSFTFSEVLSKLKNLDPNKGAGPDGIPAYFVSQLAVPLHVPLTLIFNKSLSLGVFPSEWQIGSVIPVFKSGAKNDVTNYRQITILDVFAKVFESLVYDRLFEHVENRIIPEQHGFFRRRSIESNLISYTEYLHDALDSQVQVDSVYTDFSKAFDKISHSILLRKLADFGIHGCLLRWFRSYLFNRSQYVALKNYRSEEYTVTSGVPQGSHLGPLLFIISVNDINSCFKHCRFLLYADDLKIFRKVHDINDAEKLQSDLDRFCTYCSNNDFFLNLAKCSTITFTRNVHVTNYNYRLNGVNLARACSVRDLGIMLDSKLLFDLHINSMVASACKTLGFILRQSRYFLNARTIILLYNAYVLSRLMFASCIWNPRYNVYIDRIENVQNKLLRFLAYKNRLTPKPDYPQLRRLFGVASLESRRRSSDICVLYKILHNYVLSPDILDLVSFNVSSVNFRHAPLFRLPTKNTNAAQNSPLYRMMHSYDQCASDIDILNISLFNLKRRLRGTWL